MDEVAVYLITYLLCLIGVGFIIVVVDKLLRNRNDN